MATRLYPDRCRMALKGLGLTPSRCWFRSLHWRAAFGLAAVLEQRTSSTDYTKADGNRNAYFGTILQLSDAYVYGFNSGWVVGVANHHTEPKDRAGTLLGNKTPLSRWEQQLVGWWDGAMAAEACGLVASEFEEAKVWDARYLDEQQRKLGGRRAA